MSERNDNDCSCDHLDTQRTPTTLIFLFYDAFESLAHSYLSLPTVGNDPKMIITGVLKTAMETLRWSAEARSPNYLTSDGSSVA